MIIAIALGIVLAVIILFVALPLLIIYWKEALFIFGFLLICFVVFIFYILESENKNSIEGKNTQTYITDTSQKSESIGDLFSNSSDDEYGWYDRHNVAMAYRCYSLQSCNASQWAKAVYNDEKDSRGKILYDNAYKNQLNNNSLFPSGLCVIENATKICELGNSDEMSKNIPDQTLAIKGNNISCINLLNKSISDYSGNGSSPFIIKPIQGKIFCVSDFGDIEIDKTLEVKKYYGKILSRNIYDPIKNNYYLPNQYDTCLWTYGAGSGSIPGIEIANSTNGPAFDAYAIKAFCVNGDNQVDIYTLNK